MWEVCGMWGEDAYVCTSRGGCNFEVKKGSCYQMGKYNAVNCLVVKC